MESFVFGEVLSTFDICLDLEVKKIPWVLPLKKGSQYPFVYDETRRNFEIKISLIDMSPQCDSMMVIWNDIGWYLCNLISRPLSGIWMAVVVTAFSSLLVFQALFDATKYLKSFDNSSITSGEGGS
ncbi:hypothetical protein Y032_0002g894 [Ancylostoma ceylanicum]|uniref:Uncharacterized protein n=1 Tax=Ancylostoma ceylanicum TaxID=53326 RepID=A0A016W1V1_9BILA|nr:hypothetical protein Y032_0002g894 [Ancylostoma ceylanicum]